MIAMPGPAEPAAGDGPIPPVYERVLAVVREIPYGRVATYGQIAMIVGDCTPRMVGFCLASLGTGAEGPGAEGSGFEGLGAEIPDSAHPDSGVPWHRVINAQGKISPRGVGDGALRQRALLLAEGVEFSSADRVSFRRFGWLDPY